MKPTGYLFITIGEQTEKTPVRGLELLDAPYLLIDTVGQEMANKLISQVWGQLAMGMGAHFQGITFSYTEIL